MVTGVFIRGDRTVAAHWEEDAGEGRVPGWAVEALAEMGLQARGSSLVLYPAKREGLDNAVLKGHTYEGL